ncbi:MAG: O-antigen ligase family protein [Acidimicrobiia bacterium]|nr:O-antigen ligase family protein [Acidimicrobiia bacterium]
MSRRDEDRGRDPRVPAVLAARPVKPPAAPPAVVTFEQPGEPHHRGLTSMAFVASLLTAGLVAVLEPALGAFLALSFIGAAALLRSRRDVTSFLTLFLVAAFVIPSPQVITPLGGSATPATMIGLAAAWLWINARIVPTLGLARERQPVRIAILVWGWATLASYAAAWTRPLPGVEARAADRGLVVMLSAAGLALLAADGVLSRDRLDTLLRRTVWIGAFVAVVGLVQFAFGFDLAAKIHVPGLGTVNQFTFIQTREGFRRVAGTAYHPIEYAVVLCALLPLALHFALRGPFGVQRIRRWAPVVLIGAAIPTSVSRTAVVGVAVAAVMLLPAWSARRRFAAVVTGGAFMVAVQVAWPGLVTAIVELFTEIESDVSYTTRTADYASGLREFVQRPVFGRGFRTFHPEGYFFIDNQYLMSLIETGVLGVLALASIFVVGMTLARGARHRSADPVTRDLGQSLAAAIAVSGVCFATFDALSFPMITGLTFLLVGCAGALWRLTRDEEAALVLSRSAAT